MNSLVAMVKYPLIHFTLKAQQKDKATKQARTHTFVHRDGRA